MRGISGIGSQQALHMRHLFWRMAIPVEMRPRSSKLVIAAPRALIC